jgi:hypothetical protein
VATWRWCFYCVRKSPIPDNVYCRVRLSRMVTEVPGWRPESCGAGSWPGGTGRGITAGKVGELAMEKGDKQ